MSLLGSVIQTILGQDRGAWTVFGQFAVSPPDNNAARGDRIDGRLTGGHLEGSRYGRNRKIGNMFLLTALWFCHGGPGRGRESSGSLFIICPSFHSLQCGAQPRFCVFIEADIPSASHEAILMLPELPRGIIQSDPWHFVTSVMGKPLQNFPLTLRGQMLAFNSINFRCRADYPFRYVV